MTTSLLLQYGIIAIVVLFALRSLIQRFARKQGGCGSSCGSCGGGCASSSAAPVVMIKPLPPAKKGGDCCSGD
ncbi:FeoB-associated Cys-rich membrane protein [Aquitalea palustris]|uniref:FeoB-associated Cys-rich membrane protein n=1 Tax=Aquitalea palustris TaxID=2480983 RepID=A0A454JFV1_9NEIS|nr:FeoB-associated Cys-rich membrane protein [Aquitalea palustris]RMC94774.1 FeoB-associated Cys-rich membrane protein [Aquitalea palustris]